VAAIERGCPLVLGLDQHHVDCRLGAARAHEGVGEEGGPKAKTLKAPVDREPSDQHPRDERITWQALAGLRGKIVEWEAGCRKGVEPAHDAVIGRDRNEAVATRRRTSCIASSRR
jgi:hypothetical protein